MTDTDQKHRTSRLLIRGWFLFTALIAVLMLWHLAVIGEASLHSVFLGYSASRLLMMGTALLWIIIGFLGFLDTGNHFSDIPVNLSQKPIWKIIFSVLFLSISLYWIISGFLSDESYLPYFERIQPMLILGMVVFGSGALLLFYLNAKINNTDQESADIRKKTLLFFLIACGIYLFIRTTGIGITPDEMDWQPNGMAVQYWEVWLSVWIALTVSIILRLLQAERKKTLTTVLLFFFIWICTAVLWISIPSMDVLDHSYFMEITAPNYLPYPASDSAYYGLWAKSILAGLGFKTTVTTRQFLIIVFAFLDRLTNGNILKTIDCLTALLALIPACIYLTGKRLHSHGAGILAAGFAALREYNTILLGPYYMVSNSKMLLSDLPAMLCMLAILNTAINWFQNPRSLWRMVLAGCVLGLSVTVRSQFIILVPFFPIIFIVQKGISFRDRLKLACGYALTAMLIVSPWLIRSKIITGNFLLDEPGIHSTELARRWSDDVNNIVSQEPGESDAAYAARNKQHMVDFFREKPLYVIRFSLSHFLNNVICAFTALPFGTDPGFTVRDVTDTGFHDVERRLTENRSLPVIAVFFILIALGIAAACKRVGAAGSLPLAASLLYLLFTAFGRYSGWRFALPADWFLYFYCVLGIAEIAFQTAAALGEKRDNVLTALPEEKTEQPKHPAFVLIILVFFLVSGILPAVIRELIPQRLYSQTSTENIQQIKDLCENDPEKLEKLSGLMTLPDRTVLNGQIIYPRFFYSGQGLSSGHPWTAYKIRDYSRLGFVLLNEENYDIILPISSEPAFIPNAADIYVIGADDDQGFFRADAVIIPQNESNAEMRILTTDLQE